MKRPPFHSESAIIHSTEETGDVQSFAICDQNYDPTAIRLVSQMEREAVAGYRLYVERGDPLAFTVQREDGTALTRNVVNREGAKIRLHTSILQPMPDKEAAMLADLEQCAAIALMAAEAPEGA